MENTDWKTGVRDLRTACERLALSLTRFAIEAAEAVDEDEVAEARGAVEQACSLRIRLLSLANEIEGAHENDCK